MSDNLSTFEKFSDPELAATVAAQLRAQGIESSVENESPVFDVSFAYNAFEPTIQLKLRPGDFRKARQLLEQYYQDQLAGMDPDYYLFSFSDAELMDLVRNPDEWGPLDYVLAKQILANHGKPVSPEEEADFRAERIRTLAIPEESKRRWVIVGYLAALIFPFGGLVLGYMLSFSKKTLPDGLLVPIYSAGDRRHGMFILTLASIVLVFWFLRLTGAIG